MRLSRALMEPLQRQGDSPSEKHRTCHEFVCHVAQDKRA